MISVPSPARVGQWFDRGADRVPTTRALDSLSRSGRVGRELAWRLDVARSLSVRSAISRVRPVSTDREVEERWNSYYRWIWEGASRVLGAEVEEMGSGLLTIRKAGRNTVVWQSHVMLDDPVTVRVSLDKSVSARILADAGLPVPEHIQFNDGDLGPALALLRQRGGGWVVKPASGTGGGQGVTCGVRGSDDLLRACVRARRWNRRLLMERQLEGSEYRLLFLDGEVLGVVRRLQPAVVGDGLCSVEELIEAENQRRRRAHGHAGLSTIEVDLDSILALRSAGLSPSSVPAPGRRVHVKTAANSGGPLDTETVRDLLPEIVHQGSLAVRLLGVRLAGVDIIVKDPSRPLGCGHGAVVEINALPGLHYHYLVSEPERATPVAVPILAKLLGEGA